MSSAGDYTILRGIIANYGSASANQAWTTNQPIVTTNTTSATSMGTGALVVGGGASIYGNTFIQGGLFVNGTPVTSGGGGGTNVQFDMSTITTVTPGVYGVSPSISTVGSVLSQSASQGQFLVKTGATTYGWSTIYVATKPLYPLMYAGSVMGINPITPTNPYILSIDPPLIPFTDINSYNVTLTLETDTLITTPYTLTYARISANSFKITNAPTNIKISFIMVGS